MEYRLSRTRSRSIKLTLFQRHFCSLQIFSCLFHMQFDFITMFAHDSISSNVEPALWWYPVTSCATYPLQIERTGCVVFFFIRLADQVLQTFTPSLHSFDSDFSISNENAAKRVFEECPPPTARLHTPRTDEDASLHHNSPDANDLVG